MFFLFISFLCEWASKNLQLFLQSACVTHSNVSPVVPEGSGHKFLFFPTHNYNLCFCYSFVLDEPCCVCVQVNVSSIWIRHLEESRCSDIKSNQLLQMSHRFLEQKRNVKSKSLWLRRSCGPARKLLFLGSLNPSSTAPPGFLRLLRLGLFLRDGHHLRRSPTLGVTTEPHIWFTLQQVMWPHVC